MSTIANFETLHINILTKASVAFFFFKKYSLLCYWFLESCNYCFRKFVKFYYWFWGVELLRSLLCHSRNIHIDYYYSCFLHKLSSEGTVQWVKSVFTVWYLTPVAMLFLLQWIIIIISTDPSTPDTIAKFETLHINILTKASVLTTLITSNFFQMTFPLTWKANFFHVVFLYTLINFSNKT